MKNNATAQEERGREGKRTEERRKGIKTGKERNTKGNIRNKSSKRGRGC